MIYSFLALIMLLTSPLVFAQPEWKTFTQEEMSSQTINLTYCDRVGNFWVGTNGGLYVYTDKWVTISHIDLESGVKEAVGDVKHIWEDIAGNIWVASRGKLFVFNGDQWITYKDDIIPFFTAKFFLNDSRDDIWLCSEYEKSDRSSNIRSLPLMRGTVTRFNGRDWISYDVEAGGDNYVQHGNELEFYTGLMEDDRGYIWIGTVNGLRIYAGNRWLVVGEETLPSEYITGLIRDKNGNIWVSTAGGMARFDGSAWEVYKAKDGMGRNFIREIWEDNEGRIWVYIIGNVGFKGLCCFDKGQWTRFEPGKDLPKGNIISSFDDFYRSGMIITRSGAAGFDGNQWHIYGRKDGLEGSRFYTLVSHQTGQSWISTEKGLFSRKSSEFIKVFEPSSGSWEVTSTLLDRNGRLWVSSSEGDIFLTEDGKTSRFGISDGLTGEEVKSFAEDLNGRIWAVYKKGVALFKF